MNILIPHKWLLEQLDTKAKPEEIAEKVSLCGPSIEHMYDREGDIVYDIEVTTNRVDSMSVRGIAREAAVILSQLGTPSELKALSLQKPTAPAKDALLPLPKVVNDPSVCKRTMGIVLRDVKRAQTPDWMAERLRQIEINVHDAVIDITNYITHELGHPCHAFDYDKIMALGGEIIVTEAKAGEKFETLDGEKYATVGGEIVYKNQAGEIIDLPAIKGTANTAIDDNTTNVYFWIESLDAKKVRFASMTHAIRTVAAQLNEKKVDPHLAEEVFLRGIELYQEICDAKIASEIYDDFPGKKEPKAVSIDQQTIEKYLGIELDQKTITTILEDLGCKVDANKKTYTVTPPTFRRDILIPADIVEEIARIYGYHNLPSTLMDTPIPTDKPEDTNYVIEEKIKHFLADIGWQEIYSYSMVSEKIAQQSGYKLDDHLKLQNPLSDDRVYMRRSLLPSLEEIIDTNSQHAQESVFELALTYQPVKNELPTQKLQLGMVSTKEYRAAKGDLESLLQQFFLAPTFNRVEKAKGLAVLTQQAEIVIGKETIGQIGLLASGKTGVSISIEQLLKVAAIHPTYQPIPKTSLVSEDLTFTLPAETSVGDIVETVKKVDDLIYQVQLKDQYKQNSTFSIVYHDSQQNLTSEQVAPVREKIVKTLATQCKAELVGALG